MEAIWRHASTPQSTSHAQLHRGSCISTSRLRSTTPRARGLAGADLLRRLRASWLFAGVSTWACAKTLARASSSSEAGRRKLPLWCRRRKVCRRRRRSRDGSPPWTPGSRSLVVGVHDCPACAPPSLAPAAGRAATAQTRSRRKSERRWPPPCGMARGPKSCGWAREPSPPMPAKAAVENAMRGAYSFGTCQEVKSHCAQTRLAQAGPRARATHPDLARQRLHTI